MPETPDHEAGSALSGITALQMLVVVVWLSDMAIAWSTGMRWLSWQFLLPSAGTMFAAAWVAIAVVFALPPARSRLFAISALILMLPVSFLLWLERLAWKPAQHHIPGTLWIAITCLLFAFPFALAMLRPLLLIAVAPLLVFGYQVSRISDSRSGWKAMLDQRAATAVVLAVVLFLASRLKFPRVARHGVVAFTACVAIIGTGLFFSWSDKAFAEESVAAGHRPEPPAAGQQNIVMVVVDTLRADRLGMYGYRVRDTSPFLDRFAARATLFKNAYASTSWTVPSVATMFTGHPPEVHGVTVFGQPLPSGTTLLAERLRRLGYYTIGISTNPLIDREGGFSRGFATFTFMTRLISATGNGGSLWMDTLITLQRGSREGWLPRMFIGWTVKPRAADAVNVALQKLQAAPSGAAVFLFVHLLDPHHPPSAPPPSEAASAWAAKPEDSLFDVLWSVGYDREIRYVDSQLERFIRGVDGRLDPEKTTIVIVADHGEELGEGSKRGHGQNLDEAVIRVPLIIRWSRQSGIVIEDLFSLNRLRDLLIGPSKAVPSSPIIRAHLIPPAEPDVVLRSVESTRWKLVETMHGGSPASRQEQLFRLPDEITNRAGEFPLIAAELRARLALLPFSAAQASYDAAAAAKLRSLGYLQ